MRVSLSLRLSLGILMGAFLLTNICAQTKRREHLTPEETDRVREAQLADQRAQVFTKAAERRFLALTVNNAASSKEAVKDVELWGAFPTGTRAELLGDLAAIIDEAINNIDAIAERKPDDKLVVKALHLLATSCKRWVPALEIMLENAKGIEKTYLLEAIEYAQSVIEAEKKVPPEEKKK